MSGTLTTHWSLGTASYLIEANTGIGCPEYTPGLPVTAVMAGSATQVALGAVTSAAEGAMVKLARFGTVRAFPPVVVDVTG